MNFIQKILQICKNKPVSLEVFADEYAEMKKQAKINKWAKNVFVKVPISNSKGKFMGKIIILISRYKLNITAVYSAQQTKKILNSINKKQK